VGDLYRDGVTILYADTPTDDVLGAIARNNNEPIEACPENVNRAKWEQGWRYMDKVLNPCRGGECG
jgi:hypothetical protein